MLVNSDINSIFNESKDLLQYFIMFKPVDPHPNFPAIEEKILKFWKENKIFEKSVEQRSKNKQWTFLDGPPFITGLPHYGSLLSSIPKDVFPRFYTMMGYRVRRVWGWDCHGLPAENKVEEKLKIKRKRDIEEKIGIQKFIDECKNYVSQVSSEWEWYIDHIGRWVDFKNAYKTMDLSYMETVMWIFKQLYDKGLIYKGLRVSLYCPHCVTPISNFEVAMDADNYREMTDPAAIYKYQLQDTKNTYLLAWSTTPWNKLATTALAVNPHLIYVKVKQGDEYYILAESTLSIMEKPYEIIEKIQGQKLIGLNFIPHYDFYPVDADKKAFVIVPGDFVTADEGTGIVTIAAYGEEDLDIMQKNHIQIVLHVDEEGIIKKEIPKFGGMYYLDADPQINKDLTERGLIYHEYQYKHSVATCWRCHTRLFYAPQDAWYVDIQRLKPKLIKINETINWFPKHFQYGRFLKSMENAPDWCISRSRYWGSPVPVWECDCGGRFVAGSIAELEKISSQKITDLHKPTIDEIVIPCQKCGRQMRRVAEVLDSWIEAGSAPYAEHHFPFNNTIQLTDFFPPDFIIEYTGQIRAWFYVLHVIGVALFDLQAFKNVLVTGVVLGTDGRKMSKNYGNYPDPKELLQKYGGDALRLYLMGSPVMHGEDIRISEDSYRDQNRFMLGLWNVYNFFITYAIVDKWTPLKNQLIVDNVLDRWIISRFNGYLENVSQNGYQKYNTVEIVDLGYGFLKDLSLWYVRRIRNRVGLVVPTSDDKNAAYHTLWFILKEYVKSLAPLMPFLSEEIYRNLTGEQSIHLSDWTEIDQSYRNNLLEKQMDQGRALSSSIHNLRKEGKVKVQIPLRKLNYTGSEQLTEEINKIVLAETNVYELIYQGKNEQEDYVVSGIVGKENQDTEMGKAREIIRTIQKERKNQGLTITDEIVITLPSYPKKHEALIKKKAMAQTIKKGDKFCIEKLHEKKV